MQFVRGSSQSVTIPRDIVYVWCVFRCEKTKRVAGANEHDVLAVPTALGMYLFCIWVGVNLQGMLLAGDRVLGLLEDTLRLLLFLDHVLQAGAEIHIPGTRSSNSFKQWIRRTTRQGGTVDETKGKSGESRLVGLPRRPNCGGTRAYWHTAPHSDVAEQWANMPPLTPSGGRKNKVPALANSLQPLHLF